MFYSFIISIATFDVIPVDEIKEKIFSFSNSTGNNTQFSELGFESTNIVDNLGSLFLGFFGFAAVIISIVVFKILSKKYAL